MNVIDILFGFLSGIVSCVTPEALLLFPLALGAAGAIDRKTTIAPAIALGLSLVLTGIAAGSLGMFGFDARSFRRIICAVLMAQGIVLMSASLVERFPRLTGGRSGAFGMRGGKFFGGPLRQVLLALFVGANWIPSPGLTLAKASLMAADWRNSGWGFVILFAFGIGAAVPWIVLGRVLRILVRPFAETVPDGMAGKRLLGLSLLVVAILGGSGLDAVMTHWLDGILPSWTRKLAMTF